MKKKLIAALLIAVMMMTVLMPCAFALEAGEARVTIGANLDQTQVEQVYKTFGINRGDVKEVSVTNDEERSYLDGLVSEDKIGSRAISCAYITTKQEGEGLDVSVSNINWCTGEIYTNALLTAGITDARVVITAPFAVSGTGALTGIYKAYEDITGTTLKEENKEVATEELITTADLSDTIGSEQATELVTELKKILDETKDMTDDEVREQIRSIAKDLNIELNDEYVEKLLKLVRSLEGLSFDDLMSRVQGLQDTLRKADNLKGFFEKFGSSVATFFQKLGAFISGIFGNANA